LARSHRRQKPDGWRERRFSTVLNYPLSELIRDEVENSSSRRDIRQLPGGLDTAAPAFLTPDKAPPQPFIQWPGVK
jgi:hypothetical protein